MVEVIGKGELDKIDSADKGSRAYLKYDGHTAVMSLYRNGERQTWLLTGWEDYKEKAPGEIGPVYDGLNPTLSEATRFHPEEGAGAKTNPRSDTPGRDQGLPGATLSETTPSVTEREQSEASDNSKPPVSQKSKRESTPNGRTYFLPDGTSVIDFFDTANKSTSFHEFGHHVFNKMMEFSGLEGVDPQMAKDVETILKEAHVSRESFDADIKNARRRAHEFFARGFEKYLAEGKAPTKTLRDVFSRIRNWMIEVYERIANITSKQLSDEMRGVYDRLFASDGAFGDVYGAEDVKAGTNAPAQTQEMVTTTTRKGVEVDTKVRDTSNDTRMMDLFNNPNVVAERHAKFRPFFGMAKEAVEKQERMRSNWNKAVDAIYGGKGRRGLLSKEQVPLFNETLLDGDALGKAFTAEELRERGCDDGMVRAYRLVRGLYDNAHRMLSAQRNKYGKEDVAYREGYVPHFFHAWRVLEDGKIVTSYRSMNEAIKAAEKMKAEDGSRKIRVAPALDDFGGRGKLKGLEQVRFWAPMVALTGVFGLPGFDWLEDWLKSIFGKDLELETKKLVSEGPLPEPVKRTILYGALSNLGIDVGRRAGMGDFFPSEMKDLTGPAAATIGRVVESLPKIFDDGNFMDTIEALSPGLANPIKAVMGETRDRRRDRVAFRYETMGERVARATGARPIREAIENDAVRIARYDQQKRSAAEADAIDDFLRVVNEPGTPKYEKARRRLAELRIAPERVRAEGMHRRGANGGESTAYERAMRGARTPRRHEDYRSMQNYAGMWN